MRPGISTCLFRSIIAFAALVMLLFCASPVSGHAVFMTYVRHEAVVTVDPVNIDITLELTFYEIRSLAERRRMDRDHDDAITAEEKADYLASLREQLAEGMALTIAGRPVEVVELFSPEMDLLGVDNVAPSHHVLRMFFFARTPGFLADGSDILLESRLWGGAPAITRLEITGEQGITVVADSRVDDVGSEEAPAGPPRMRAVCVKAGPGAATTAPAPDGTSAGSESTGGEVEARGSPVGDPRDGPGWIRLGAVGIVVLVVLIASMAGLGYIVRRTPNEENG